MAQEKKATADQGKGEDSKQQKDAAAAPAPKPYNVREALQSIVALIEKCVKAKETRLQSGRLLRQTAVARRHVSAADLAAFLSANLPEDAPAKAYLLGVVAKLGATAAAPMEDDAAAAAPSDAAAAAAAAVVPSPLPEVEVYSYLLVAVYALDQGAEAEAWAVVERAVARLRDFNRRTLDVIASRVRLLLGEIPERAEFSAPGMRAALAPYFELTTAVRSGDLGTFRSVTERYAPAFDADRTSNLISRLHHNVIRTGLHRINLAYSRISLKDIASKLALPSAEDAEFIAAKAIRDGGLAARIDRAGGSLASAEVADVYSTAEPQAAFHARIAFCLDIHNEAVKAMRFDADAHRRGETEEQRRERLAAEAELAAALAEEEDDMM
ncbi:26S proteasome non-ATPase regulatory subunit 3 [Raphidocelis subcapitata]|uniref:26S proteasome non-ATPase regulatory subunit 3 n=1 Tax=Raphidocelis subcapitata TaxID=307507 RepID=A0A2V0PE77_9CHLO|nr:26S proteasome non-ATPase regulatory subunit 3 [Raphidocelis subcapitata]|eukprot:GBF97272.1 26S proteasome non-ATPase regulatory subunit 3 [Raphidocelis subcapitata]